FFWRKWPPGRGRRGRQPRRLPFLRRPPLPGGHFRQKNSADPAEPGKKTATPRPLYSRRKTSDVRLPSPGGRERRVRLTLAARLAYLDDTLEATQTKQIGQKVAESDLAQELIERIKQLTRRRRLSAPPATGPGAKLDPNTIAEYLDNVLPPEKMSE